MNRLILFIAALLAISSRVPAAEEPLQYHDWTVDDVKREAMVYAPASATKEAAPLVFVFHGHGGTMRSAAAGFRFHEQWPQAIVIYPQGLPTPGRLTDPEGKKSGWQSAPGGQNDRDLKFFDAMLKSARETYKVDAARVYCTGHSNGGGFTYVLWAARGDAFAAVAPSSAVGAAVMKDLKPKPVLHVAGRQDPLVKYEWQEQTINALRKLNGCEGEGKKEGDFLTVYPSPKGTPVAAYVHDGGHSPPKDVTAVIVKFFKEQAKKE